MFLGGCYLSHLLLINLMSSSVLHDQIPYSILFPPQPLFCLPLGIFGCFSFVHLLCLGEDKLSAKITKYIFLGYSRLYWGYRCFCPNIDRYFIPANVTLFEDSSFFTSMEHPLNLGVMPLPLIYPSLDHPIPSIEASLLTLWVYTCSPRINTGTIVDSTLMPPSSPNPIYNFLSYHSLLSYYFAFVSTLSSIPIPNVIIDTLSSRLKEAMVEKRFASLKWHRGSCHPPSW